MDSVNLVTWETLGKFSIAALVEKYKSCAPVAWHLTECMAASCKNGVVVVKKQQSHLIVCILMESNISTSFTFSCRFKWVLSAPSYLHATTLQPETLRWPWVWHFAFKSHIDVKCVYSQFGYIVSDLTVCKALNTMTGSSLATLWEAVNDATKQGETEWCLILDNVQEYCPVYEGGIGRESILKVMKVPMHWSGGLHQCKWTEHWIKKSDSWWSLSIPCRADAPDPHIWPAT